jgi:hypothetical protein
LQRRLNDVGIRHNDWCFSRPAVLCAATPAQMSRHGERCRSISCVTSFRTERADGSGQHNSREARETRHVFVAFYISRSELSASGFLPQPNVGCGEALVSLSPPMAPVRFSGADGRR